MLKAAFIVLKNGGQIKLKSSLRGKNRGFYFLDKMQKYEKEFSKIENKAM
jgi:hypothetical protein